jgi:hypothetical protein
MEEVGVGVGGGWERDQRQRQQHHQQHQPHIAPPWGSVARTEGTTTISSQQSSKTTDASTETEATLDPMQMLASRGAAGVGGSLCSVCLGGIVDGPRHDYVLACGHRFHVGCIARWLDQHATCPTCGRIVAGVTRVLVQACHTPLPGSPLGCSKEQDEREKTAVQTATTESDWILTLAICVAAVAAVAMLVELATKGGM